MTTGRNLVLAGFMGTGKTTVGQLVAKRLGFAFVDSDDVVEARAGCTIAELFAQQGEPAFRALEEQVCLDLAAGRDQVIATGGGALLNDKVRAAFIASGMVVCLTSTLDEIIRRVGHDASRPLFAGRQEALARLLDERTTLYNSLPYQIDTTHRTPEQVAEEVNHLWNANR